MAKKIGVVGSPSTTGRVTVDIVEDAAAMPLHGQLVYLDHPLSRNSLIALGTMAEINTENRWHEDANMRGVLKKHGSLPHLSEVGDVRTADVLIQAAYEADSPNPSTGNPPLESGGALSMSPTTGAAVYEVTDDFLQQLLRRHKAELSYLGYIYRSEVRLPLKLRHFGLTKDGGIGEAYHLGVFGMNGSGKTAFSAYMIAAYLRHKEMGVLIMDPQGQFTTESRLPFSLQKWTQDLGRKVYKYSISHDLRLPQDGALLAELLGVTEFFKDILTVKAGENRESAIREFARKLRDIKNWHKKEPDVVLKDVLTSLSNDGQAVRRIYSSTESQNRLLSQMQEIVDSEAELKIALELFRPLHNLFAPKNLDGKGRKSIWPILESAIKKGKNRPLAILDSLGRGNRYWTRRRLRHGSFA